MSRAATTGRTRRRKSLNYMLLGVLLLGTLSMGSSCDDLVGNKRECSDEDFPLLCPDTGGCCPKGFPIHCGGQCYKTQSIARANCGARIDTCERE